MAKSSAELDLRRFQLEHQAPERGLKRVVYLLGENGSILRELMKAADVRLGWWSKGSTVHNARISDESSLNTKTIVSGHDTTEAVLAQESKVDYAEMD